MNMQFSTYDRDYDKCQFCHCARSYGAGWWFRSCSESNLNGQRFQGRFERRGIAGIEWKQWKGFKYSLKTVEMKIRPYYV